MKRLTVIIAVCTALAFGYSEGVIKPGRPGGRASREETNSVNQNPKTMYLIRNVFTAKPGKAKNLVQVFKKAAEVDQDLKNFRIMTDVAADFWTVIVEHEVETLSEFEDHVRGYTSSPEMAEIYKGYLDYIESGRREVYLIE